MSLYSLNQIKSFSRESIKNIIPLDDESIDEIIQYAMDNFKTRQAISNHFLDLLGPSELSLNFIEKFGDMLFGSQKVVPSNEKEMSISADSLKSSELNKSIPASKKVIEPAYKPDIKKPTKPVVKPKGNGIRLVKTKVAPPTNTKSKGRMSGNSSNGATTSEMFDMKPATVEIQKQKKKESMKKIENIQDLDDVLLELELMNSTDNNKDIRVCNCNATRHPLFEMYPNCLNCGKIICSKEGLQPCSFCGKSLMSNEERQEMIAIFNKEKQELEEKNNENMKKLTNSTKGKNRKNNVMKISLNTPGQNNFQIQEQFYKKIEEKRKIEREQEQAKKEEHEMIEQNKKDLEFYNSMHKKDDELIKAEERLATLLSFQDNGAERTKIIDHAADFELPTGGNNLWASPMERALQLKRQQKQFRKMEEGKLNRSGRGNNVLDMTIKDGKVVLTDKNPEVELFENLSDDEEINELQQKVNKEKFKQFKKEVKNVYDYDEFSNTLFKPVYNGNITEDEKDNIVSELPLLGSIVQLGDVEQQENQLFNMIGV